MSAERVLDASVVGAAFFTETATSAARAALLSEGDWIAPDLIFVEIASLAAKKVRRGECSEEVGTRAVASVSELLAAVVPSRDLAGRAFQLAVGHVFSAYDGLYLALAEARGCAVVTADRKFASKAGECGFGNRVHALP